MLVRKNFVVNLVIALTFFFLKKNFNLFMLNKFIQKPLKKILTLKKIFSIYLFLKIQVVEITLKYNFYLFIAQ